MPGVRQTNAGVVETSAGVVSTGEIPDSVTDHWRMDEGSGTTVANDIGSIDVTLNGATWESDADSVGGFQTRYDGTDDYAVSDSAFSINQTNITGIIWFRFDAEQGVLLSADDSGTDTWRIDIETGNGVRFAHRSGVNFNTITTLTDGGSLTAGTRYMAAMAISGDNADCYLYDNTGQVDSASGTGARDTGANGELYLGDRSNLDTPHDGTFDSPALARGTQMTQSEIDSFHDATSP